VTSIVEADASAGDALALAEEEAAKAYGRAAKSGRTRVEYARDWAHFAAWCAERGLPFLPASPPVVARYVGTLGASLKIASIRRRVVAISQHHKERGFDSPTAHKLVREVVSGIARTHGSAQTRKAAITTDILGTLLKALDRQTLRGQRDRAILLLGFSGAFRRSELAALDLADLAFDDRGLVVTVRHSKTDQEGQGRQVGVPFVRSNAERCPVTAVREWLRVAESGEGAVFRTFALPRGRHDRFERLQKTRMDGRDIARVVQRAITLAGVEGDFGGHSLRAGFVTAAAQKKVPEVDIMRVTGHRSSAVLRGYVRRATLFEDAPLTTILG
jgi:integrase